MTTISPNPTLKDLKITFKQSILVFPSQQTERKSIYLSNIDQILNYNIPTLYFFPANQDFPPEIVSKRLKLALEKVLVTYDFMAGRLKLNHESGRLEIDCNAAGAGFVVASSEFSLHELGDLVCPNLGFKQLAVQTLQQDNINSIGDHDNQPLCIIQVTSFKCGGFAIGMSVNHILLDGMSAKTFNENLASQAFDKPALALINVPFHDRRLLAARSPPLVAFPHPEFFKPAQLTDDEAAGPPVFDCKKEELDFKIFKLTPKDISFLKDKAIMAMAKSSSDHDDDKMIKTTASSFAVVVALIWRCKALSINKQEEEGVSCSTSTLLNVVDLRSRLTNPALPPSYCGNAVLVAYASEERGNIEKGPFWKLVEKVSEGPKRVSDEYARSVIDWLEINKGLPNGEYMVSSWLRLGFEEVVYPWGKALHSGPVVNHRKDICWVFPTRDDHVGGSTVINALVSLPPQEMNAFQSHFNAFFSK